MASDGKAAAMNGGLASESKPDSAAARETLRTEGRRQRLKLYVWAAGLTAVMVAVMFISSGIYPFGKNVLRYLDDGAQNFGILGQVQRSLLSDENILFSWSTVLGGNMIGLFAYYAASPFNLLSVFFPDDLMAAYHFIFAVKFVAAAVCFAVMLRNMFPEADGKAVLLFSVSYPFMGFMTYYAWNQSWMDGIIFLPLVLLGICRIVRSRKPLLYTITLALTLLSNFYTGYMVCLGSALLFVTVLILSRPASRSDALKTCLWYIASTAVAAALTAFLLLPAYYTLPDGRSKSLQELIDGIGQLSKPDEVTSMLYTAPYNDMRWGDNYPVIFTGIVQLVLVILFFLNDEISHRYKVAAAALLAVFAVSFGVSMLNTMWHGFSETIWFSYRYSFLVSFLLEIIAFYSFVNVRGAKTKVLLAGGVLAVITLIALRPGKKNIGPSTLILDIIMICATLALLYAYSKAQDEGRKKQQSVLFAAIAAVVVCNLTVNSYWSLGRIGENDTISAYRDAQNIDRSIAETIDDDGFYRMGSTWRYGDCDPMRVGYAGVENFASSKNTNGLQAASRLGVRTLSSKAYYGDNTPLSTDALLGLRYIATGNQHKAKRYTELGQVPEASLHVYRNPYALPVLFPGESLYNTPEGAKLNKFERMSEYWDAISSEGGSVFSFVAASREDISTADGHDIRLSFTVPRDGPVYAYIPEGDRTVDGPVEADENHQDLYYVGEYATGEEGEFLVHAKASYDPASEIVCYSENVEALAAKTGEVQSHELQIDRESSSELSVRYTADEDGFVTSTIPFDEGWHVYVDGTEAETYRNMDTFLAFDVPEGEHEIRLVYWPPYFWAGVWISVTAAAAVAVYAYLARRRKNTETASARDLGVESPDGGNAVHG